ncbi:hypothetical protein EJB05_10238, partial [Eragrostis curvula]
MTCLRGSLPLALGVSPLPLPRPACGRRKCGCWTSIEGVLPPSCLPHLFLSARSGAPPRLLLQRLLPPLPWIPPITPTRGRLRRQPWSRLCRTTTREWRRRQDRDGHVFLVTGGASPVLPQLADFPCTQANLPIPRSPSLFSPSFNPRSVVAACSIPCDLGPAAMDEAVAGSLVLPISVSQPGSERIHHAAVQPGCEDVTTAKLFFSYMSFFSRSIVVVSTFCKFHEFCSDQNSGGSRCFHVKFNMCSYWFEKALWMPCHSCKVFFHFEV